MNPTRHRLENDDRFDLFIFMGLHSGLFSLIGAWDCASIDSLSGSSIGVDAKTSGFVLVGGLQATQWCFETRNRRSCLDILARHNEIDGPAAEHTLDTLLDPEHGLYPKATINLPGVAAALDLRAELGYLACPVPPVEKYVDLSYYRKALSIGT